MKASLGIRRCWTRLFLSAVALVSLGASAGAQTTPFARVAANGTVLASSGVGLVELVSTGRAAVTFSQPIDNCAVVATTDDNGGPAHMAKLGRYGGTNNRVYVDIREQNSFNYVVKPFTIAAFCGQPGTHHALVDRQGNVRFGIAGVTASRLSLGRYRVNFVANVSGCAYLAQVGGGVGDTSFSGYTVHVGSAGGGDVLVETKSFSGVMADIPFNLGVVCSNAVKASFGVVGPTGLVARSSPGESSFRQSVGSYQFVTNGFVARCGTIVTRGHVGVGSLAMGTVQSRAGLAPNLVGVTARNMLASGGALADHSFHAATFCT